MMIRITATHTATHATRAVRRQTAGMLTTVRCVSNSQGTTTKQTTTVESGEENIAENNGEVWREPGTHGVAIDMANAMSYLARISIPPANINTTAPRKVREARLVYQSRKRGILEMDLLLATFADKYLHSLSDADLSDYEKLLEEYDWDLYYWVTNEKPSDGTSQMAPVEVKEMPVFKLLCDHVTNRGKGIIRLPDLR